MIASRDQSRLLFFVAVSVKTGVIILFSSTLTLMSLMWGKSGTGPGLLKSHTTTTRQMYSSFLMMMRKRSCPTTTPNLWWVCLHFGDSTPRLGLYNSLCLLQASLIMGVTAVSFSTKHEDHSIHDGYPHRSLHFWWQEKTNQSIWFALSLYCWTIHQSQQRFQLAESVIELKLLSSKNFPNRFRREWVWTYQKKLIFETSDCFLSFVLSPDSFFLARRKCQCLSGLRGVTRGAVLPGESLYLVFTSGSIKWHPPRGVWLQT